MADDSNETRKRIRFISVALVFMLGVGGYLVFKAVTADRYVLLVTLLPMILFSVPMARTLIELRKKGTRGYGLGTRKGRSKNRGATSPAVMLLWFP